MAKEINEFMSSLLFANENLPEPAYIRAIMTTNGYLLTSKMLHQFVHNHIIRYQITLDGFKDIHDSTRYLANGVGTWETIVENLNNFNNLKEKNVTVLLRSNVTPALYNRIDEWLEFIHNNFCGSAFKIHFEAAKDFGNMNNPDIELIANETDVILDIIDRAKKWKLPLELVGFSTTPFSMMCYASRQSYFIIDYNGDVKKCTSSPLDEPYNNVGKLTERGMTIYKKKAAQWTSYELDDRCKNCSILALCYRRKCPLARYSFAKCELLKKSYEKGIEYRYY